MKNNRLFGLIGHPLDHSFSAKYFNKKFAKMKYDATYVNIDIAELPNLHKLLSDYPELCGLNVTIPYKSDVITLLDEIDEDAQRIGAVNVIQINKGRFKGYNTDYIAFMQSVSPLINPEKSKALILGSGGASKAVRYALEKWHIPYSIVSREGKDSCMTYDELKNHNLDSYNLIVNTTPLGNYPNVHEFPDIPYEQLKEHHVLYDLTYNPEVTAFLSKGIERNCKIKNGYDMLIRQAELAWGIWNE